MLFVPRVDGRIRVASAPERFFDRCARRVRDGLLGGAPHSRSHYVVLSESAEGIGFRAEGWWTVINVGLNEVDLRTSPDGSVQYQVTYWRWAAYVAGLCGSLGAMFLGILLVYDMRGHIAQHPEGMLPGGIEVNLAFAWAMALFWGFAWPWILVELHKRPLQRLIERLIAEVDATSG